MRVRNIFGTKFSGALGKSLIASTWKGHEYIRTYTPQAIRGLRINRGIEPYSPKQ